MKKKSFLKIGGAMLLLAIVLNIQYAWGDYGIKDHPLHLEVLAQSNDSISTGGDGDKGTGTDTGTLWTETSKRLLCNSQRCSWFHCYYFWSKT